VPRCGPKTLRKKRWNPVSFWGSCGRRHIYYIYICTTIIYIYIHICTTIIYIYTIYTPYIYI
jgi:hypothetical protein